MEFTTGSTEIGRLVEAERFGAKALLVGAYEEKKKAETIIHLEELERLTETFGLPVVGLLACPLRKISAKTFLGKGKVEEIKHLAKEKEATLIIFDHEISPQQQRNLEKEIEAMVVDRTELILAVFGQRAHTKEAKMQIALAEYTFQLPRLKKLWTHLGRQRVGGGGKGGILKGEGERQIEIDRRLLRSKISSIKQELVQLEKTRALKRAKRKREGRTSFAIIGYTNAGKSTLLNALTEAAVFVEDKLFATLDTKAKSYLLPNNQKIILIDTVGFIRKLPHRLVEAFKSTLEEAFHADILLHLIDASSPNILEEIAASEEVLKELKADKKPRIRVLNKIEKAETKEAKLLRYRFPKLISISAKKKMHFDCLIQGMVEEMAHLRKEALFRFDQKDYKFAAKLMEKAEIIEKIYDKNDLIVKARVAPSLANAFQNFQIKNYPSPAE